MNNIRSFQASNARRAPADIYVSSLPGGDQRAEAHPEAHFDLLSFSVALVDTFGVERVGKIEPREAGGWTAVIAAGPPDPPSLPPPIPLGNDDPTDPAACAQVAEAYHLSTPRGDIAITRHRDGTIIATAHRAEITMDGFFQALADRFGVDAFVELRGDVYLEVWRAHLDPDRARDKALDRYARAKAHGERLCCLATRKSPKGEGVLLIYQHTDRPFALYAGGLKRGNLADELATFDEAWDAFEQLYTICAGENPGTFEDGWRAALAATAAFAPHNPGLAAIARAKIVEVHEDTFEAGWDAACAVLKRLQNHAGGLALSVANNPDRNGGHCRGIPRAGAPVWE